MGDIRSYIDEKYDDYFTAGKPEFFSCANYIGIQEDGSLVLNDKVKAYCKFDCIKQCFKSTFASDILN